MNFYFEFTTSFPVVIFVSYGLLTSPPTRISAGKDTLPVLKYVSFSEDHHSPCSPLVCIISHRHSQQTQTVSVTPTSLGCHSSYTPCSQISLPPLHLHIWLLAKAHWWGQSQISHLSCHKVWVPDSPRFLGFLIFSRTPPKTPIYFLLDTLKFSFSDKRTLNHQAIHFMRSLFKDFICQCLCLYFYLRIHMLSTAHYYR